MPEEEQQCDDREADPAYPSTATFERYDGCCGHGRRNIPKGMRRRHYKWRSGLERPNRGVGMAQLRLVGAPARVRLARGEACPDRMPDRDADYRAGRGENQAPEVPRRYWRAADDRVEEAQDNGAAAANREAEARVVSAQVDE